MAIAPAGGISSLVELPPRQPTVDALGALKHEQPDGSVVIDFEPQRERRNVDVSAPGANLAEAMEEGDLQYLAEQLLEGIEADIKSREPWESIYTKGLALLGLDNIGGKKDKLPFEGACDAVHPMLTRALINFQSDASGEMLPAEGPVKADLVDDATEDLEDIADRVVAAFNYYLTETDRDYYPEFGRMLMYIGLSGNGFKKVYDCPLRKRPVSDFITPLDLIVSYFANSLKHATRVTHRTYPSRGEMRRLQIMGFYRDVQLQPPVVEENSAKQATVKSDGRTQSFKENEDEPHTVYETRCERDFSEKYPNFAPGVPKNLPVPYIVTVEKDSRKVLRVERDWDIGDPLFNRRVVPGIVKYGMFPGFGFYDFGLAHLIGGSTRIATMLTRMITDSGMWATFQGGFLAKGVKTEKTNINPGPGEWETIDTGGMPLRDGVMPYPYKEPSQMLAVILDKIVSEGDKLGGTAMLPVAEGRQDAPVGTTLALIEQAMKPTTAVNKRLHVAQREEFALLRVLFARNPQAVWGFRTPQGGRGRATAEDFAAIDVIPVSDPNIPSATQRLMRSDALGLMAREPENAPLFNRRALLIKRMKAIGEGDAEALLNPPPEDAIPMDPASENIAVMQGLPIKSDVHQDHISHIAAHAPILMGPAAQANPAMVPILAAHINEHFALHYRQLVESMIGMPLPPPGQPLPPEIEQRLSAEIAHVAGSLQEEMAKMAVGPFGADEHMVKMMENQVKAAKIAADARNAEIDNRVQAAELQAAMQKHAADMANAEADRAAAARERQIKWRDQNVKLAALSSAEKVARINAAAAETAAEAALQKAEADKHIAKIKADGDAAKARAAAKKPEGKK